MAEGWLRHLAADRFHALSAGANPAGYVHPLAIRVMAEVGVDISHHRSKSLAELAYPPPEIVITVCDHAREACPTLRGTLHTLHWTFPDPAQATGTEEEVLAVFRHVRDDIRHQILAWLQAPAETTQK